ncbi:hypothetical protein NPIL_76951 [Nephila pilipes]|uniref:Uncharacterized protein n=1 Tax=Nephila pilipes TaxID=299642 RepID=A0A8X6MCG0_NEPPI|nr:hypothetical protein NPIL_76951 [Nephila pilipes]
MTRELVEKMEGSHSAIEKNLPSVGRNLEVYSMELVCFMLLNEVTKSLPTMIKIACTLTARNAKNGLAPVNKQHHANKIFFHIKRCCAYGGTGKGLSIMNCLNGTKWSMINSMFNRWNVST